MFDVIVIGEGVAGLSAANAAAKAGARVATFEGVLFGGLVVNVNALDPTPDPNAMGGADYAAGLSSANAEIGVESIQERVESIEATGDGFVVRTSEGEHRARRVIAASGARLRPLGIPGEADFEGRGVSSCADCDAPLFKGDDVVVVGSGDSALQEALVLAEYCGKVHLVHHGEKFTGRADLAALVAGHANIVPMPDAEPVRIEGADGVERVVVRRLKTGDEVSLACRGLFAYTGLVPNTDFLPAAVVRDAKGRLVTNDAMQTSLPGLFAAGAVRAGCGGLITDAVADGTRAGAAAAAASGLA